MIRAPNNLGVNPLPDPVSHFGLPWRLFWILRVLWRCRRWATAPFAARLEFISPTVVMIVIVAKFHIYYYEAFSCSGSWAISRHSRSSSPSRPSSPPQYPWPAPLCVKTIQALRSVLPQNSSTVYFRIYMHGKWSGLPLTCFNSNSVLKVRAKVDIIFPIVALQTNNSPVKVFPILEGSYNTVFLSHVRRIDVFILEVIFLFEVIFKFEVVLKFEVHFMFNVYV